MEQIKKGNNRAVVTETWRYWHDGPTEDIDHGDDPWAKMMSDVADLDMGNPVHVVGNKFEVYCGHPLRAFAWATFMVCGVKTTVLDSGVKRHKLLARRITEWDPVDTEAMRAAADVPRPTARPEPPPPPPPPPQGAVPKQHEGRAA